MTFGNCRDHCAPPLSARSVTVTVSPVAFTLAQYRSFLREIPPRTLKQPEQSVCQGGIPSPSTRHVSPSNELSTWSSETGHPSGGGQQHVSRLTAGASICITGSQLSHRKGRSELERHLERCRGTFLSRGVSKSIVSVRIASEALSVADSTIGLIFDAYSGHCKSCSASTEAHRETRLPAGGAPGRD